MNQLIFEYEHSEGDIEDHIKSFEELLELMPNNPKIQYNLAALKLKNTTQKEFRTSRKEIWALIVGASRKLDKQLTNRLKINYHILNTEYLHLRKEFKKKNSSLRQVYNNYKGLDLTDYERLYLARFLSIYSQFRWAENILASRAYQNDALSFLVDYYLRLTITDSRKRKHKKYIELLQNTARNNKETFCGLFYSKQEGGYTFQLLDDQYLADMYCENCSIVEDNP